MINSKYLNQVMASVLTLSLSAVAPAQAQEPLVQLQIESLEERIFSPKGASNSILVLSFKNLSKTARDIRFYGEVHGITSKIKLSTGTQFSVPGKPVALSAGSCASLKYDWYDVSGKLIQSGIADLSGDDMQLPPNGVNRPFYVPIAAPSTNGKYRLHVVFNNKNLIEIMKTYGHFYDNLVYLEISADKTFLVIPRDGSTK
ncbi:hypothetical protein BH10CYA1_BH10CYA1_61910 [soil metagenome]